MTSEELLQLNLEKLTEQNELLIVFANIVIGLFLGFLVARGMTRPWK